MEENAKKTEKAGQAKKRRHIPLRWSMLLLVFVCWVLPMLLTITASAVMTARNTRSRVSDVVSTSVENTVSRFKLDLDSVVNEALSVSYVSTIRQAYTDFTLHGSREALINTTREYLNQKFYRANLISAAHVVFPEIDGHASIHTREVISYIEMASFYSSDLYANAPELLKAVDTGILFAYEDGKLYLARQLSLRGHQFTPYALLVLQINTGRLFETLHTLPWLTDMAVSINDVPIVLEGDSAQMYFSPNVGDAQQVFTSDNGLELSATRPSERYSIAYYARAELAPLMQEMGGSIILVVWAAVVSSILITVLLYLFVLRVNRPIKALSQLAGEIEEGHFGATCDTEGMGSAEFVYLGTQMNAMSTRLLEQFDRLYREELALRDATIKSLQSQINPHFLGNTLEIINWEARLAGNVRISRMLEALSTMLDAALDRRQRQLIHLSEEMMYVNSYLYILGERLGKRLVVDKEIDPALLDWYVPRLILQPIVENAIEHGVSSTRRGYIIIRAYRTEDDWMTLEVENNNTMSEKDIERVRRLLEEDGDDSVETSSNIGIRNVNRRLRIIYGEKAGLTVKNAKNGSTISSMCIQHIETQQIEST